MFSTVAKIQKAYYYLSLLKNAIFVGIISVVRGLEMLRRTGDIERRKIWE